MNTKSTELDQIFVQIKEQHVNVFEYHKFMAQAYRLLAASVITGGVGLSLSYSITSTGWGWLIGLIVLAWSVQTQFKAKGFLRLAQQGRNKASDQFHAIERTLSNEQKWEYLQNMRPLRTTLEKVGRSLI
jgi:hypothetical protein